ncbi:hypothetical protein BD410DRAFT_277018 [Rickenella mellea]|uniref:Peptidase C14 caspase domain-containing protein n=1 Tax=Rickenella mellea TaxID=50990 RepID=A0A4Y7Q5F7_9AGAM|nr:hypothetical protein BD410DRAFT_277018 [Rickenella mellea]
MRPTNKLKEMCLGRLPRAMILLNDNPFSFRSPTPSANDGLRDQDNLKTIWSSPVFALVIGINAYQSRNRLNGAVADANAFDCFLKERFSSTHVTNLRDAEATRENIKSAFTSLRRDPRIKSGDTIIIYFAGHGARANISDRWVGWKPQDSQMEIICPVDIGVPVGADKKPIGGIPDRTVGVWLNNLAKEKGNNITVILDCCHSAGANRGDDNSYIPRQILNPPDISHEECYTWTVDPVAENHRGAGVPSAFVGQNQESHVLLAACGQTELALENNKRGLFTGALLDVLSQSDLHSLTYESLIQKIKIPEDKNQNPHCQGRHRNRLLFNAHFTRADSSLIPGFKKSGIIALNVGQIHGIKESSHFAIYGSIASSASSIPICSLVVKSITPTTSNLSSLDGSESFDVPSQFYAKEISKEMIQVYCEDEDKLTSMLARAFSNGNVPSLEAAGVILVQSAKSAKLRIGIEGDQVAFYRQDDDLALFAGHRIPHIVSVDNADGVLEVLGAASRFQRQLGTTSAMPVTMELRKLRRDHAFSEDFELITILTPIGPNLIDDNKVDMVIEPNAVFGATIHNHTSLHLYPYLFYFDCSDFSIIPWYVPPVGADGRHVDPPLPAKSRFSIGYGNDGAPPYEFFLPEGEKKDVGFFKLYLTTCPTDLSYISQSSAFENARGGRPRQQISPSPNVWGSNLVIVFMKDA